MLSHALARARSRPRPVQIASGEVFGPSQPVVLQMLGSDNSFEALEGVAMERPDNLHTSPSCSRLCSGAGG